MDQEQQDQVLLMPTDWVKQQMKSFTIWINMHLKKRGLHINSIQADLCDGRIFIQLLEIISGDSLPPVEKKNLRLHQINNVNRCIDFITKKGVKLAYVGAEEIVDGNLKMILGCIWCIILRFAIQSHEELGTNNGLLLWVKKKTDGYKGVNVHNFTDSFSDGLAFNALIHRHRPDLLDYSKLGKDDTAHNLNQAFDVAEKHLGIPRMFDVADMEAPDSKSVMTYISMFYHEFSKNQIADNAARRINRVLDTNAENANRIQQYERIATQLLEWINRKTNELQSFSPDDKALDELIRKLTDLNIYRSDEKPPKAKDKATLENLASAIKTRMHLQNRPEYNPIQGQSIKDIQQAWDKLNEHEKTLLERLLFLIRQLSQIDNILKKYYYKCDQQDGWMRGRSDSLSTDVSNVSLFELTAVKSKIVELTNEIESRESRLKPITLLRDRLNDLHCQEMNNVNSRHSTVFDSWSSLKTSLSSFKDRLAAREKILLDIDRMKQQYSQFASDLKSFFEFALEDLNDTYLVNSVEETEALQRELSDFLPLINDKEAKLLETISLGHQVSASSDPKNQYCSITCLDLQSKLEQVKEAEKSRRITLSNELENQKKNDNLKHDFAKLADDVETFRSGVVQEIQMVTDASTSLEGHVELLKNVSVKVDEYYKKVTPVLDRIGKSLQEQKIYHNPYTAHTFESINSGYQQLFDLIASSISEVENQIIVRDSSNITEQQVKDYRKSFDYFDKERVNYLNYEDFRAFLISLEYKVPVDNQEGDQEFARITASVDPDHSLRVAFNSFLNFVAVENKETDNAEQILKAFRAISGDKDYITPELIRQHFPTKVNDMLSKMVPSSNPAAPAGALDFRPYVATIYGVTDL